jgi:Tol biopolymer transport system component
MGSALAALSCGSEPAAPDPGTPATPNPVTQAEIVFQAEPEQGNSEIYSVNADGTGLRRLTTRPGRDFAPSWSPDGSQIYFSSVGRDGGLETSLYAMDPDGSNVRLLLAHPPGQLHTWSPDGERLAFAMDTPGDTVTQMELYVLQADGTGVRLIVGLPRNFCDEAFFDCEDVASIGWAPDGHQLAFSTIQFGRGASVTTRLLTVRDDGTGLQPLWGPAFGPSWSPDGRRIAFAAPNAAPPTSIPLPTHLQFLEEVNGKWDALTVVVVDGGLDETQNVEPSWSPDGASIVFRRIQMSTFESQLYIVGADGTDLRKVATVPRALLPKWRPRAP